MVSGAMATKIPLDILIPGKFQAASASGEQSNVDHTIDLIKEHSYDDVAAKVHSLPDDNPVKASLLVVLQTWFDDGSAT